MGGDNETKLAMSLDDIIKSSKKTKTKSTATPSEDDDGSIERLVEGTLHGRCWGGAFSECRWKASLE